MLRAVLEAGRAVRSSFRPPDMPTVARRAFRLHMTYTVLAAIQLGMMMGNVNTIAVKALHASDRALQLPQIMISLGLFVSAFTGTAMARHVKKPFVWIPGIAGALSILAMAWTRSPLWFLGVYGVFQIFDFALRPAFSSIVRSLYPSHCRSHAVGTLQQYHNIVLLASGLLFAFLLGQSDPAHAGFDRASVWRSYAAVGLL